MLATLAWPEPADQLLAGRKAVGADEAEHGTVEVGEVGSDAVELAGGDAGGTQGSGVFPCSYLGQTGPERDTGSAEFARWVGRWDGS